MGKTLFSEKILGFFLALLLSFPIAIQAFHAIDDHDHLICFDHQTHLHKKTVDCDISLFHFQPFAQVQIFHLKSVYNLVFFKNPKLYQELATTFRFEFYLLRAPPAHS